MLSYASVTYGHSEKQNVMDVFDRGWFSGGYYTDKFEKKLAKWWGVKYAVAVNSGSSANFIAMQALDLDPGSRIITTPGAAFPTTISPIIYHRHTPIFVDIRMTTLCIDESQVLDAAPLSDAIIFAHTLGNTPNMDFIMDIARNFDLKVIEDCCDAMGSKFRDRKVGTFGDMATVSFYPAHHMTTGGEGGAILTNNPKLYKKCKSIRDWGRDCVCGWNTKGTVCKNRFFDGFDHRYYYTSIGMNLKMTEFQAAFGVAQLEKVEEYECSR